MKRRAAASSNPTNISFLRNKSTDHYKRVILHLDLDCFYAQVEHNRLGIPLTVPLAVQQWNGLIAVNYAARDAGIKRHTPVSEALIKCPQLRLVHVPTYSVSSISQSEDGEEIVALPKYSDELIPSFRADGSRIPPNPPDPATNKACLEPYRQASLQIFRLIRSWAADLSPGLVVEKGGLDEAFIDITEEVEQQLIDQFDQKYTMIRDELDEFDSADLDEESEEHLLETLKLYETSWMDLEINYEGLGEMALDKSVFEGSEEQEDLVESLRMRLGSLRIWKGSQLAKILRSRLRSELNYIASIGIASNKMLAKLTSAIYKPDKQTRLEPAAIKTFMKRVPFERIRMMGGKMGKSVLSKTSSSNADDSGEEEEYSDGGEGEDDNFKEPNEETSDNKSVMAADLWPLSISELTERVSDRQTAAWIFQLIRGQDASLVTPRSLTKSFMSAKSFRPTVRDWPELHDWVVVLVGELWSRVAEEREASGRWPSSITVHFNRKKLFSSSNSVTRSCEFPFASTVPGQGTRAHFLAAVFKLFNLPDLFPMTRLDLSVSNFKSLDAEGKSRPSRVDHFFTAGKQETNENSKMMPESLERFFNSKQEKKSYNANANAKTNAKTNNNAHNNANNSNNKNFRNGNSCSRPSVLDLLRQASASTKDRPVKEALPHSTENRKSEPSAPPGILKYFKAPAVSNNSNNDKDFRCKERACSFKCDKDNTKAIQEHTDYHIALKLYMDK